MSTQRLDRVRTQMSDMGIDVLLLSVGSELPWLTGYEAMPLERLTMLVVPVENESTMVVPLLEAPRVVAHPELFSVRPWHELENPVDVVAGLIPGVSSIALGDKTWAQFVFELQKALPHVAWQKASNVTGPLRRQKDAEEIVALEAVAVATDRVAQRLMSGEFPLIGRTELEVADSISRSLLEEGLSKVEFCIVGSGPNGASPHHEPSNRTIGRNEMVVCDFGGLMNGYMSDTTRTVCTGGPTRHQSEVYEIVAEAQRAATVAAKVGTPCEDVDAAARSVIARAGYAENFIHRTGHGIGCEVHEDPYIVSGNSMPLESGNAFSIEPGIYIDGDFGVRIEDIVLATEDGPRSLNNSERSLQIVEA